MRYKHETQRIKYIEIISTSNLFRFSKTFIYDNYRVKGFFFCIFILNERITKD